MVVTHLSHMSGMMHDEWEACLAPYHIQTGYDGITLEVPPPTSAERASDCLPLMRKKINKKL